MLQLTLAVSPPPPEAASAARPPPPAPPSGSVLCSRFVPIISGCLYWLPGLGSRILHELRTTCPFFSRGILFSSRMFRTKRSVLVRRLWRSRAPGGEEEGGELGEGAADSRAHGAGGGGGGGGGGSRGCCMGKSGKLAKAHIGSEAELKALTHSVLKRLKEKHLEGLLQAVESRGGARTACLLLPSKVDSRLGQHWYSLPLLLCKVFRWPDLRHCSEVKRLCCCESYGKAHPDLVCCNPYHLSRLCELESPPPPYSRYPMDFLKPTAGCPDSVPSSTETGGTNYLAPGGLSGKKQDFTCTCADVHFKKHTHV
ncbi:hypothetical protein EYD10_09716 [Varanus komodoensis]|nr:hypothetical protein EYD10_09716 [Varanus komodoensis]